jgi:hypothetical protein
MTPDKDLVAESCRPGNDPVQNEEHGSNLGDRPPIGNCLSWLCAKRPSPMKGALDLDEASQKPSPPRRPNWFIENSLRNSFRPGKCLICSNLIAAERRAIHSFLYEGMMAPQPRAHFLEGGGFCLRHFWIAKRIEEECWPAGGIGVAILCENLLQQVPSEPSSPAKRRRRRRLRGLGDQEDHDWRLPGFACAFCRDNEERERALLQELGKLIGEHEWSEMLADAPPCFGHTWLAFQLWEHTDAHGWIESYVRKQREHLNAAVREFIRKRDWQYRNEPRGPEQDAVPRAIEFLVGPVEQFPDKDKQSRHCRDSRATERSSSFAETPGGNRHAG